MKNRGWIKYVFAFAITAAIFGTAFYATTRIDDQRISDIRSIEENISIDILSSETQYDLLGNLDCEEISQNTGLSDELNSLAERLSYAETNLGDTNTEVIQLKEQYSLLEIKDYLLLQEISQKCSLKPVFILYFYSNAGDCPDCGNAGDVLTYLREQYPGLRVYSFDYNLDLSAIKTLIQLKKVNDNLPAFIVNNGSPIYGFKTLDQMQALIPELGSLSSTTSATSSAATSTDGF